MAALITLVAGGIGTLLLSHNDHGVADQAADRAFDLAECAAEFQYQRLMATQNWGQTAYTGSNLENATYGTSTSPIPVTSKKFYAGVGPGGASISTSTGTLNDSRFLGINPGGSPADACLAWVQPVSPDTSLNITSSNGIYVYGEGQVGGIWRQVRMKIYCGALFDNWCCFSNKALTCSGSLSCTPTTGQHKGCCGSNTSVSIHSAGSIGGCCVYGSATPDSKVPATNCGSTYQMPTINSIAERAYSDGGYPSTSNTGCHKFCGSSQYSSSNDNYGCAWCTDSHGNWTPLSATGNINSGCTFPLYFQGKGNSTCSNCYLTRLNQGNPTVYCYVGSGPVNVWIDNTSGTNDTCSGNVSILAYSSTDRYGNPISTTADACKCHVYYNNPSGSLTCSNGTGGGGYISTLNSDATGGSSSGTTVATVGSGTSSGTSVGSTVSAGSASTKYYTSNGSCSLCCMLYSYNTKSDGTPCGSINLNCSTTTCYGGVACHQLSCGGNCTFSCPQSSGMSNPGCVQHMQQNGQWQEVNPVRGD